MHIRSISDAHDKGQCLQRLPKALCCFGHVDQGKWRKAQGLTHRAGKALEVDAAAKAITCPKCIYLPAGTALHVPVQSLATGEV